MEALQLLLTLNCMNIIMLKVHMFIYKMITVYAFDCANSIQKPLPVTKGKQLLPQNACPSDLWQDILGDGGGYGLIILSFNDFSTGPAGHLQMYGSNETWDIGHLDQNCSLCTLSKICPLVKTPWTANGTPLSSHMQWHTRCWCPLTHQ